jgi:hypothetical protein
MQGIFPNVFLEQIYNSWIGATSLPREISTIPVPSYCLTMDAKDISYFANICTLHYSTDSRRLSKSTLQSMVSVYNLMLLVTLSKFVNS